MVGFAASRIIKHRFFPGHFWDILVSLEENIILIILAHAAQHNSGERISAVKTFELGHGGVPVVVGAGNGES